MQEEEYFKRTTFSKIKKGEFFRFKGKKKVYIFDGKPNRDGKYAYHKFDDANSEFFT